MNIITFPMKTQYTNTIAVFEIPLSPATDAPRFKCTNTTTHEVTRISMQDSSIKEIFSIEEKTLALWQASHSLSHSEINKRMEPLKEQLRKLCVHISPSSNPSPERPFKITLSSSTAWAFSERLKALILKTELITQPAKDEFPLLLHSLIEPGLPDTDTATVQIVPTINPNAIIQAQTKEKKESSYSPPEVGLSETNIVRDQTLHPNPPIRAQTKERKGESHHSSTETIDETVTNCSTLVDNVARGSSLPSNTQTPRDQKNDSQKAQTLDTTYPANLYQLTRLANVKDHWSIWPSPSIAATANVLGLITLVFSSTLAPCKNLEFYEHLSHIKRLDEASIALILTAGILSLASRTSRLSMKKLPQTKYENPNRLELDARTSQEITQKYDRYRNSPWNKLLLPHARQVRENLLTLAENAERDKKLITDLKNPANEIEKQRASYIAQTLLNESAVSKLNIAGALGMLAAATTTVWVRFDRDKAAHQCQEGDNSSDYSQDLAIYTMIPFLIGVIGTIFFSIDAYRKLGEIDKTKQRIF